MTRFDYDDSDVVVVVGSGAGGGTVANELCQRGIKTVVLEAGPHLTGEDYHQDEWPAFAQMAWSDPRTTSGSWKIATDFPNLPAWIVKAVGGTTTHWAGACPRFKAHELAARSTYGDIDGATCSTGRSRCPSSSRTTTRPRSRWGSPTGTGGPPLPANNNYKVFANGAEKLGYRHYATGPYATNAEPYDGRPATVQDGFNFQGDKQGSKWSTLVAELPKAEATGNLDLRPDCHATQILHDASGRATGVLYVDRNGALRRQRAAVVCVAGNSIETPRLLLLSESPQHPDGLANSSGQVGRNYMRHTTGDRVGPVRQAGAHVPRRDDGRRDRRRVAARPEPRLRRRLLHGDDLARPGVPGQVRRARQVGLPAHRAARRLPEHRRHVDRRRGHAAVPTNRITLSGDTVDAHQLPVAERPLRRPPQRRRDAQARPDAGRQGLRGGRGAPDDRDAALPVDAQPRDVPDEPAARATASSTGSAARTTCRTCSSPTAACSPPGAAANPTLTIVALAIRQAEFIATELPKTLAA